MEGPGERQRNLGHRREPQRAHECPNECCTAPESIKEHWKLPEKTRKPEVALESFLKAEESIRKPWISPQSPREPSRALERLVMHQSALESLGEH
eukprot:6956301-Pyramimonas_sp.AAC.2